MNKRKNNVNTFIIKQKGDEKHEKDWRFFT